MKRTLRERLGREWLFCDGGSGSILQSWGLAGGELPEMWNLTNPDKIIKLNQMYFEAGANIVNTNTFGANRLKFPILLPEIIEAAVENAKKARINAGREDDAYVALDLGPTGKLLEPMGDLSFDSCVDLYAEVIRIGVKAGADLILIETMSDTYEAKAAVLAAKENCELPVLVTMTFDKQGKLLTGGSVTAACAMLEGLHVDALGINCSLGPKQMIPIVRELVDRASIPVIVNPNAGLPREENGRTVYDVSPGEFAEVMGEIADLGVQVCGGCCGTTPDHIKEVIKTVSAKPFRPQTAKRKTYVTSFSKAVEIGAKPVIIGERINPTGKKKFKEALRNSDIEYILGQGLIQEDGGADILDVNVGLPEINEPDMMELVVKRLQGVTALPLQIDTGDTEAMERALRCYNGKPMVNSTNGRLDVMEAVMPIVAKYGGVLVGLALDESGIPDTADGRIAVAKKIYEKAQSYGIPEKDIVIDGLAMTISSEPKSALVTLETIRRIRDELHGHSILGVSNISFGLPARSIINSHFFTMALQNGLSMAIINPNNDPMMQSYRAYLALTAQDPQCMGFIGAYADYTPPKAGSGGNTGNPGDGNRNTNPSAGTGSTSSGAAGNGMPLGQAIKRGMIERAGEAAREEIAGGTVPLDLINEELIPALDEVGKGFESGTLFLPQLLMAADAAKAAFAVVKEAMSDTPRQSKGTFVLATVKGDIHDIGKNIVKVLLENYGYEVIDLGKDVAPEIIVDSAIEHNAPVVGLSALMTTTVGSMEETIKQLRAKKPDTKVVVGGAVMTQKYADAIGADKYAKDAMETVRYADEVFASGQYH